MFKDFRMRNLALVVAALLLGFFSPWMASPDDGAILFLWFNWLPTLADHWFMPDTPATALALDVSVLAAQYLALFALVAPVIHPAKKLVADFVHGPRHRSGLVR